MSAWTYFAEWTDFAFASIGMVLGLLIVLWWRQQSDRWYTIFSGTLLVAAVMDIATYYLFVVPPHRAGCTDVCFGRIGYPLPFAHVQLDSTVEIFPVDFALNLLLIWLVLMAASVLLRFVAEAVEFIRRTRRFKIGFFLIVVVAPMALLPRYVQPPEARVRGEELRLSVNARRAAEVTYAVTGLWVHRLALEDIRYTPMQVPGIFGGVDQPQAQVCLRGYTYFYIPWRRYRITLDRTGVTALNMTRIPLTQSCWS